MKETFILAPGANQTELIRSLALHGMGSFGLHVYSSAYTLARDLLLRKGVLVSDVVNDAEAQYIFNNVIKTIDAFKNSSLTDAINIASSLKTLRSLIPADEDAQMHRLVSESDFAGKNESLLEAYAKYRSVIGNRKDQIDIVREALEQSFDLDAQYVRLTEFPLLPLEEELLKHVSTNHVKEMSLLELLGVESKPWQNISYVKAYGSSNEVEDVLNYIFENSLPLDDCVVAVTNPKYNQLMLEYSQKHDLPVTFANGISINNTNPARLLRLYYRWDVSGYHGVDPLMDMLYSSCFDMEKLTAKFGKQVDYSVLKNTIDRAGQLKLSPDLKNNIKKANDYVPLIDRKDKTDGDVIRVLAEELGRDCVSFISEYALIRDEKDEEALRFITRGITEYLSSCSDGDYSDLVDLLLGKNVGKSSSRPASLIVTDIRGALSTLRKHLFVIGLSSANFPGTIREDYLLLDEDMELYGTNVPVSTARIERKKEDLKSLLDIYSSIDSQIRLYYSSYDMTGIKQENASSVLFDIYQTQNPSNTIKQFNEMLKTAETSYLGNKLSVSRQVLDSIKTDETLPAIPRGAVQTECYAGNRSFSPSALENFFVCPKRFYLQSILGIEEPDPDDPLVVIDARDMGTLVHSVMEYLADNPTVNETVFMKNAEEMFNDYLKKRVPDNEESAQKARREFLEMARNGYRDDPKNHVEAAEEKFSVVHEESGITIYGYPDRVEKDKDGNYLIADYKTKRNYEHVENDIDTCLQVVLYAYMMSHRKDYPVNISYCTYRYLRYSKSVECVYNQGMEEKLAAKLELVRVALDNGEFPCTTVKDNCKYCKFASICGKNLENEVTEDE